MKILALFLPHWLSLLTAYVAILATGLFLGLRRQQRLRSPAGRTPASPIR